MTVYSVDPIYDPRWRELVQNHPCSSVFHTVPWLESLERTYGYKSVVFTSSAPNDKLDNGVAFCRVRSWLTGQRLVSLPFSDHCGPLCNSVEQLEFLVGYLQAIVDRKEWKYVEVRPPDEGFGRRASGFGFRPARKYVLHRIDLQPDTNILFKSLDKNSIQRRIRHAERSQLVEERGRSEGLLKDFYSLLILTRSRHHVPPQPYIWFQNLVKSFGEDLEIRLAYKDRTPVAAILTLRFKDTAYYKYGCSDKAFNHLGATPLLLWKAIVNAKSKGATEFDLGRTDEDNAGLIAFKGKWGARSQPLVYLRVPDSPMATGDEWKLRMLKHVFACMPARLLEVTGNLIYRHIG
jgi:hypothetical protein